MKKLVLILALLMAACGSKGNVNVTQQHGGEGRFEVAQVKVKDRSVTCIEVILDGGQDLHIALSCDWNTQ